MEAQDDFQKGERVTVKVLDPVKPSQKEIDEHELTHLPFRTWCRECVHRRGVEMPHRARIGDDGDRLMKLNVDFMFLGPRGTAGETIPVLVIREEKTRMTLSSAVHSKTIGEFVARRVLAFLSEIGCLYGDVIVKSDQEPALISLVEDVDELLWEEVVGFVRTPRWGRLLQTVFRRRRSNQCSSKFVS